MNDHHLNIFSSDEDDGYIAADIPDLGTCSAFGRTPEEAPAAVEVAKDSWLKAASDAGRPIPVLCNRPAIYQAVK